MGYCSRLLCVIVYSFLLKNLFLYICIRLLVCFLHFDAKTYSYKLKKVKKNF